MMLMMQIQLFTNMGCYIKIKHEKIPMKNRRTNVRGKGKPKRTKENPLECSQKTKNRTPTMLTG
jgi:hypothetical protein